jgi:hypothetical protein
MTPVYRFSMYDILTDSERESRRWGTREAINRIGGTIVEATLINVDEALLGSEIEGMTERGFNPSKAPGFQKQVR